MKFEEEHSGKKDEKSTRVESTNTIGKKQSVNSMKILKRATRGVSGGKQWGLGERVSVTRFTGDPLVVNKDE